jgi:hypothetical protein
LRVREDRRAQERTRHEEESMASKAGHVGSSHGTFVRDELTSMRLIA